MTRKRIFISYVREDSEKVDRLVSHLLASGFDVWLDRTHLVVGVRWKSVIRKAIRDGDYFVACFSPSYLSKTETFMNDELLIAIDRLRLMRPSRQWFLPILLEKCDVDDIGADYDIGAGQTLSSLQFIDFSADWNGSMKKLIDGLT